MEQNLQMLNSHLVLSPEGEGNISEISVDLGNEHLNQIMTAVQLINRQLENMERKSNSEFNKINNGLGTLNKKVNTMEKNLGDMGTKASSMKTKFSAMEKNVSYMGNKVNTMEETLSDMGANIARQQKSDSSRLGNKYKPSCGNLVLLMHTTRFLTQKISFLSKLA